MPIGVDRATVNYIRNSMMTMDDKSLKQLITDFAKGHDYLMDQNSDFLEWARTKKGYTGPVVGHEEQKDTQTADLLGAQSPIAAAVQVDLQRWHTTPPPPKSNARKKLFHVDDGGGKDPLEAQKQHGGVPLTEAEIAEQKVKTAEKKREKREHAKKQMKEE